jgi:hypothetical protein
MNLLKKGLRIESTIRIFKVQIHESRFTSPPAWIDKDWFCVIVLRIRQDLWGFVGFMKKGRIFWKSVYESNSGTKSYETWRICDLLYEMNPDSYRKARIKPFWSPDLWSRYGTNPWIRKTNPCFYESLIWFPHPCQKHFCLLAKLGMKIWSICWKTYLERFTYPGAIPCS